MAVVTTGARTSLWNNALKSVLLLAIFPLILIGVVYGITLTVLTAFMKMSMQAAMAETLGYMPRAIGVTMCVAGLWFVVAYVMNRQIVSTSMGAKLLSRRERPQVYNMLENLCIAEGMKTPRLEVIQCDELNAYASGVSESQYTITLTSGLIKELEPDELEAVIAHELAHIRHGDVMLMVISSVFVGIIALAVDIALRAAFRSTGRNAHAALIAAVAALAVALLAKSISVVVQMALSRRREFMADMLAAQMTRNPDGMVRALLRISGNSDIPNAPASMRAMLFDNDRRPFFGLMSTHPSIEDRIDALVTQAGATPVGMHEEVGAEAGPWDVQAQPGTGGRAFGTRGTHGPRGPWGQASEA